MLLNTDSNSLILSQLQADVDWCELVGDLSDGIWVLAECASDPCLIRPECRGLDTEFSLKSRAEDDRVFVAYIVSD